MLSPEACAFLFGLEAADDSVDLLGLSNDDRLFISGLLKRFREKRLDVPVLPQAALEISRLLSDPNSNAASFARVLRADPALSVEVLRIANSAYYGFRAATENVQDAVVRIGTAQLRGLVLMTHLHGKILKGGVFKQEAQWLSNLSLALARLAQAFAPQLGIASESAYTRGVLAHVEHFIITGSVLDLSKNYHRQIEVSRRGLLKAFHSVGPGVRSLAAQEWQLPALLDVTPEVGRDNGALGALRHALVQYWAGEQPSCPIAGITSEQLVRALENVRSVVPGVVGEDSRDERSQRGAA